MISAHTYTVRVIGSEAVVPVVGGTVTTDASWSPQIQGTVQIPLSDLALFEALDPRQGARVRIRCRQSFSEPRPLSAWTQAWGGSVAALTAAHGGKPLRAVTSELSRPYNGFGPRDSTSTAFDLGIRARRLNLAAGTVDVEVASDEALLQDYRLIRSTPVTPSAATVQSAVSLALSYIGAHLAPGGPDAALDPDSVTWEPGVSGWDYIEPLVQAAGLRLWCDETRTWRLDVPLAPTGGTLRVSDQTVTDIEEQVSRDGQEWFTGIVIRYRWTDSAGDEQTRYDVAGTGPVVRSLEYERRWPGEGAAASILARALARGRIQQVELVSNYAAAPGQVLIITASFAPTQSGTVTSVQFDLTADRMRVRSRELTDTPPTAYVLQPEGYAYDDVPAGVTYDTYTTPQEV